MPYKFNESRRHKIRKAKYRVTSWPEYDAALIKRGSLSIWMTKAAIAAWRAPATGKRGGQPIYSTIAIETSLALRLVFHQPLRQTEGLLRSIADALEIEIDIAIPDHTTLSPRWCTNRPQVVLLVPRVAAGEVGKADALTIRSSSV
jgi:hypothetical protein